MDIREFLEARLAEDEAHARAAGGQSWRCGVYGYDERQILDEDRDIVVYDEGSPTDGQAAHIARHDPARVLRDVASSRKLLELADYLMGWSVEHVATVTESEIKSMRFAGREIVRQLVKRWSGHPDYDPSWSTEA